MQSIRTGWPLLAVMLLALLALGVNAHRDGFWEPSDTTLIDRYTAPTIAPTAGPCAKTTTRDAWARTLTADLVAGATAPTKMRWPLVGLALLTVLAVAGIGARLGGARAAALAALVALSFPVLLFSARSLGSEIGTAAGGALMVFGLLFTVRSAPGPWRWLDAIVSIGAVALGSFYAFRSGGAILGLIPPFTAVAFAGALGMHAFSHVRTPTVARMTASLAGAMSIALTISTLVQTHDAREPIPGTREVLGRSIVPSECVSPLLGGLWTTGDKDITFNALFEHIAFGTYPLGLLAPFALALMVTSSRRRYGYAGALLLAWAGVAWIATLVFSRKVGFATYAAFPAMAAVVGIWLADFWEHARLRVRMPGGLVLGIAFFLGALTLGKDLVAFPQKLTSLFVEKDGVAYPGGKWLLAVIVLLGVVNAAALALTLWANATARARLSYLGFGSLIVAITATVLFWPHAYYRHVSRKLSSKALFDAYLDRRQPGDQLGILGDLGKAPSYYLAQETPKKLQHRGDLWTLLGNEAPAFALAPAGDLCAIQREAKGRSYAVLASTTRSLLLSNRAEDTAADTNPLRGLFDQVEPSPIEQKPPARIVFDDKIELLGWSMPAQGVAGDDIAVRLYFKVLRPVGGAWKILAHFDGPGADRINGDHDPIGNLCATSNWSTGDYITDTFTLRPGRATPSGTYELRIGFFTGSSGNWRNMRVSTAPPGIVDTDRVRIGGVAIR